MSAAELATPRGPAARCGAQLGALEVLPRGALAIDGGQIVALGAEDELRGRFHARAELDARGGTIVPGFVDAHTHPVFLARARTSSSSARAARATSRSRSRAAASSPACAACARRRRSSCSRACSCASTAFLALGTTTIEAKTGYGLSLADELKCLEVLPRPRACIRSRSCRLSSARTTCRPSTAAEGRLRRPARERDAAARGRVAPRRVLRHLHRGARLRLDESRRILTRARELGLGLRLHADQLTPWAAPSWRPSSARPAPTTSSSSSEAASRPGARRRRAGPLSGRAALPAPGAGGPGARA
jgi:imidazolonepropionase